MGDLGDYAARLIDAGRESYESAVALRKIACTQGAVGKLDDGREVRGQEADDQADRCWADSSESFSAADSVNWQRIADALEAITIHLARLASDGERVTDQGEDMSVFTPEALIGELNRRYGPKGSGWSRG